MFNTLTFSDFSDFYRNTLFVSKHTIWRENETHPHFIIVTVCYVYFIYFQNGTSTGKPK
jgi:hypothetical protein